MLPPELIRDFPENLSPQAARDLISILKQSNKRWGMHTARKTRDRMLARCKSVADGTAVGHRREDLGSRRPRLFLNEPPYVIAFNPQTRRVLRIVHGARDFPALFD